MSMCMENDFCSKQRSQWLPFLLNLRLFSDGIASPGDEATTSSNREETVGGAAHWLSAGKGRVPKSARSLRGFTGFSTGNPR